MASAKKSQYLDSISVQDIYPRGKDNSILPQDQLLVTDGQGGTTWQSVSALTGGGAFTTINTTPSTIKATVGYPFISILDGPNAGLTIDPTAPNQLRLYANAFNRIKLEGNASGATTLSAYDNSTDLYKSTISFIAGDNINISGDSSGNKVRFSAIPASNATTSTISSFITNMTKLNTSFQSNITAFNSPYSAQPFIQYGSMQLDSSGQATVSFSAITNAKQYKNSDYTVQLTYQYSTTPVLTKPLSFLVNSSNAFTIYGDATRNVFWTTYGQIF